MAELLAGRQVNVWAGHNYAWELTGVLGMRDRGSAVRAGLVHYNDGPTWTGCWPRWPT